MIIQNPIFKREVLVTSRNFRLGFIFLIFNSILASVALLNMYAELLQVHSTAQIQYIAFLELYVLVATIEFFLLLILMPALSAGGISEEREKRTLDLMLTTAVSPVQIIVGKVMISFSNLILLIISGLPILSLSFVFGGITLSDVLILLLNYSVVTIFVGSIGILCSTLFRKSTIATMITYIIVFILVIGGYGINHMIPYAMESNNGMYALLLNPISPFLATILNIVGNGNGSDIISILLGGYDIQVLQGQWVLYSTLAQVACAALCLYFAIRVITPR